MSPDNPHRVARISRILLIVNGVAWAMVLLLGVGLYSTQRALIRTKGDLFAAQQEAARLRLLEEELSRLYSRHYNMISLLQEIDTPKSDETHLPNPSASFLREHAGPSLPDSRESRIDVDLEPGIPEPHLWPVAGWLSQEFRPRATASRSQHLGVDIAARLGTPVRSPANGEALRVYWDDAMGRVIEIQHESGHLTRFAHLQSVEIQPGSMVDVGEKIGLLGNSGKSSAPHLHYEVELKGKHLDPLDFLPDRSTLIFPDSTDHDSP